jgi:hypothetical protein
MALNAKRFKVDAPEPMGYETLARRINRRVKGRYKMSKLIRAGRFGQVYIGWNTGSSDDGAVAGTWRFVVGKLAVIVDKPEPHASWEIV